MNVKNVIINIFQAINKFILQCIMERTRNVTLSKKKLAKKDLFKIKIRYNKDIKRKGI